MRAYGERVYNEHDAVCDGCRRERSALFCEWCSTFTCVHYSLEAGDDIGMDGETVHRCNACETPLVDPSEIDRLLEHEVQDGQGR